MRFIARRALAAGGVLLAVSFGTFALTALAPGNAVRVLLAGRPTSPELVNALEREYHLQGGLLHRYVSWLGAAIHLDFGNSISAQAPVSSLIAQALPVTLELAGMAFALVSAVAIPLGVVAARRRSTRTDRAIVGGAALGLSMPPFVTSIVLIEIFAVALHLLPPSGPGTGSGRLSHLLLPAVALAATATAVIVKITRTAMVRELAQDYVVFARARGVTERRIVVQYALRNAFIPIVTASGLVLGYMVGGAVLVEQAFSLPGLGSLLVTAADSRDLPTVQGVVLVIAAAVIVLNLVADLIYVAVDPRVRHGEPV